MGSAFPVSEKVSENAWYKNDTESVQLRKIFPIGTERNIYTCVNTAEKWETGAFCSNFLGFESSSSNQTNLAHPIAHEHRNLPFKNKSALFPAVLYRHPYHKKEKYS
jgi:hypothetical protein